MKISWKWMALLCFGRLGWTKQCCFWAGGEPDWQVLTEKRLMVMAMRPYCRGNCQAATHLSTNVVLLGWWFISTCSLTGGKFRKFAFFLKMSLTRLVCCSCLVRASLRDRPFYGGLVCFCATLLNICKCLLERSVIWDTVYGDGGGCGGNCAQPYAQYNWKKSEEGEVVAHTVQQYFARVIFSSSGNLR